MIGILIMLGALLTVSDRTSERVPLYHFEQNASWEITYPSKNDDLRDTTKPLVTLRNGSLTLFIHSFPYDTISERIPPQAQIARWQRQAGETFEIKKVQNGGFWGLQFFGEGVLARAMQLDSELFQNLRGKRQMRSDYTLKAIGPTEIIEENYDEIVELFDSFELINEIPAVR